MKPDKKNKGGAPRKIGEKQEAEIIACLTVGASLRDAADYIGVDYKTIYNHRKADAGFSNRVKAAVSKGKLHHLNKIANASQWQASAFMLERKWPEEFARKDRNQLDITSKGKQVFHPITLDGDKEIRDDDGKGGEG